MRTVTNRFPCRFRYRLATPEKRKSERMQNAIETYTDFTLSGAAEHLGKSKATISKAIKSGKLSAEKMENGSYKITAAELFRVYPKNGTERKKKNDWQPPKANNENAIETSTLNVKVKFLSEQVEDLKGQLSETKEHLSSERQKNNNLMLEYKTTIETTQKPVQPLFIVLGVIVGGLLVLLTLGLALTFTGGVTF